MDKANNIDINRIIADKDYENEDVKRRIQNARQKYFDEHGRWPEDDGIAIDVLI